MSENNISKKDVEYVAKLARMTVTSEEQETYQGQLENILGYIGQLKEIPTDQVSPTAHPHEVSQVWRDDQPKPFNNREALFKNAPDTEETYYKVKKVIE